MVAGSTVAVTVSLSTLIFVFLDFLLTHVRRDRSKIDILTRKHATSVYDWIRSEGKHYLTVQNSGSRPGIIVDHSIKRVNLIDRDKKKKVSAKLDGYSNPIRYKGLEKGKTVPAKYIGHITATSEFEFDKPRNFRGRYDEVEVLLEFRIEDHTGTYTVKHWDTMERDVL